MSLMPLLLADALLAPHTLVRSKDASMPTVHETAEGWTLSAALPGLSAKDATLEISVEADGVPHLWLHALPRVRTELRCVPSPVTRDVPNAWRARPLTRAHARRLPRNADVSAISASLLDGVLVVKVPRKAPETFSVPIETTPLPDDLPEPRGQVSLALPGLGAGDISATVTRDRTLLLSIKGSNSTFGAVHEVLRLPERADMYASRASMVNGVFSFSIPITPEPVAAVSVLVEEEPEAMDADAAAASAAKAVPLLLLEAAVPGLGAADLNAEVRGRTLTITSAKAAAHTRRTLRRAVLLPPHTRVEDVRATCVNGLLKVKAPRAGTPERTAIAVSGTAAAAFPPPPTPPAQDLAPAAAQDAPAPMEEAAQE